MGKILFSSLLFVCMESKRHQLIRYPTHDKADLRQNTKAKHRYRHSEKPAAYRTPVVCMKNMYYYSTGAGVCQEENRNISYFISLTSYLSHTRVPSTSFTGINTGVSFRPAEGLLGECMDRYICPSVSVKNIP